jgi:hypothetical protein
MSDISAPLGCPVPFKFGGKDILLDGLRFGVIGLVQNYMRQEKKRQLREAIAELNELTTTGLPAPVADSLNAEIINRYRHSQEVTVAEALDWVDRPDGFPVAIWAALSRRYGEEYSLDSVRKIIADMPIPELNEMVEAFRLATNGPKKDVPEKNDQPPTPAA